MWINEKVDGYNGRREEKTQEPCETLWKGVQW